jgi:hypothetical protein
MAIASLMQDGASLIVADGLVLKWSIVMNRQRLAVVTVSATRASIE